MAQITEPVIYEKDFDQLVQDFIDRVRKNNLNYTQLLPSDPGMTIADAFLYVLSLYGLALNRLPQAAVIAFCNYLGVERKGSRAAVGEILLTFNEPTPEVLIIPKGERFVSVEGILFSASEEVVVPVESREAVIPVECETRGTAGNLSANRIIATYGAIPYVSEVTNPEPMVGGVDEEIDADALERGRQILSHLWKAVTANDWEQVAMSVSGVRRAKLVESPGLVKVYILTENAEPMNQSLRNDVWGALDPKRIQGVPWELHDAVFQEINVVVNIKLKAGHSLSSIQKLIETKLTQFLSPYAWEWGRKVSLSEILAEIEAVPGVDYVDELILPVENIPLEAHELPKIGEVQVNAI